MSSPDHIERTVLIRAPRDRVWRALTEPAAIAQWSGAGAHLDLRPGGDFLLDFGGATVTRARVETVEPMTRFAYRWPAAGADPHAAIEDVPNTLVEFTLREVPAGTQLTVVESGFAALPPDRAAKSQADNTVGWEYQLTALTTFVEAASAGQ